MVGRPQKYGWNLNGEEHEVVFPDTGGEMDGLGSVREFGKAQRAAHAYARRKPGVVVHTRRGSAHVDEEGKARPVDYMAGRKPNAAVLIYRFEVDPDAEVRPCPTCGRELPGA